MLTSFFNRRSTGGASSSASNDDHDVEDILALIKAEHRHSMTLLPLLLKQADEIEQAGEVDYELIHELLAFFSGPMNKAHHAKEDQVYGWMRKNVPSQAAGLHDVEDIHKAFTLQLSQLRQQVEAILLDQDVPRDRVAAALKDFAEREINHIRAEEAGFLPMADLLMPMDVRRDMSRKHHH
ncbi:MAG: hemerythrin domain-containing protein [Alphaproteobacteria bacterium]